MNRSLARSLVSTSALIALAFGATACVSNRHHGQDTPRVTRVVTVPAGATLRHVDLNREWITPCDLTDESFDIDEEIVVEKEGFRTWAGTLEELPQISLGTYQLKLVPVP